MRPVQQVCEHDHYPANTQDAGYSLRSALNGQFCVNVLILEKAYDVCLDDDLSEATITISTKKFGLVSEKSCSCKKKDIYICKYKININNDIDIEIEFYRYRNAISDSDLAVAL